MTHRLVSLPGLALFGLLGTALPAAAQSVLVLNGTGVDSITPALQSAGYIVVNGTLDPGQISTNLAADPTIEQIWIWSDYTYGNGGVPADPLRDFDATDFAALDLFVATHPGWIMDGLAFRGNNTPDELILTRNEALALGAVGGGIVLGADDASGGSVVQHPNAVAAHFGFQLFQGVFTTYTAQFGGVGPLVTTPSPVVVTNVYATNTYCEVPHGLQPNGIVLSTAVFGVGAVEVPGYGSPTLGREVFNGVLHSDVNHLVTTNLLPSLDGDSSPYCAGDGSGTACPCGNVGAVGHGCENSLGTGGGLLSASGTPNLSADDFTLQGSDMPATATALYFQGTSPANAGNGSVFGDGLRCAAGAVVRLGTRINVGGASGYGAQLGDVPTSVRGLIPAGGGTYYYQAWYRNAAAFCTASTFNLTNGLAVSWRP